MRKLRQHHSSASLKYLRTEGMVSWPRGRFFRQRDFSMFLKLRRTNAVEKELDNLIVTENVTLKNAMLW